MNTALIIAWVMQHDPKGMEKLAARSEVSIGTLINILRRGHEPGLDIARRMAKAMGVTLDELSTPADDEEAPPAA